MSDLRVVLTTCRTWPDLSASDQLLAKELERSGADVTSAAWNSEDIAVFEEADLVVLRSNWDFHYDLAGFTRWLDRVEASGPRLRNPAPLIRWSLDKRYLSELTGSGLRVPALIGLHPSQSADASAWAEAHELDQVVLKPAWGASGFGVELLDRDDLAGRCRALAEAGFDRDVLVQEYMPEISEGEFALVFFDGMYSHAYLRTPGPGDFRVNGGHGGGTTALDAVDPLLIEFGSKVAAMLPDRATYLRVDVVADRGGYAVMEIEVNEPALGLHLAPGSARRFADAILATWPNP